MTCHRATGIKKRSRFQCVSIEELSDLLCEVGNKLELESSRKSLKNAENLTFNQRNTSTCSKMSAWCGSMRLTKINQGMQQLSKLRMFLIPLRERFSLNLIAWASGYWGLGWWGNKVWGWFEKFGSNQKIDLQDLSLQKSMAWVSVRRIDFTERELVISLEARI